jgi:hypothetical protein
MTTKDGKRPKSNPRTARNDYDETSWEREHTEDRRLMDLARRLVRGGAEVVVSTQDVIRERAGDIKSKEIPKELVESVAHITARTKDELVGLMAREFKNYLEKLDLVEEARSIIEQYSLDVNMTIRLRPNDSFADRDGEGDDDETEEESGKAAAEDGSGDEEDGEE